MRIFRSWTSLKLASTHTSLSAITDNKGVPAATLCPSCTVRLATKPSTGAGKVVRCRAKNASRTLADAAITPGWVSMRVPSVRAWLLLSWSRALFAPALAAASALWVLASCDWAWLSSSLETAPLPTNDWRRAKSSLARATSFCARAMSVSRSVI